MQQIEDSLVEKSYHIERFILLRTYFSQIINYNMLEQNIFILQTTASNCLNTGNFSVHEMIYHNIRVSCEVSFSL